MKKRLYGWTISLRVKLHLKINAKVFFLLIIQVTVKLLQFLLSCEIATRSNLSVVCIVLLDTVLSCLSINYNFSLQI